MACSSLAALSKTCGDIVTPGVSKVYIIAYEDLQVAANGDVYTTATNGMVSAIDTKTAKQFVEIGILPESAGITENFTKNASSGNSYFTQTFTVNLADLSVENRAFVESVMNQDVVVITKDKGKVAKYYIVGHDGLFTMTGLESGTGVGKDDAKGYKLTFSGTSSKPVALVDPTIIAGLLAPGT